MTVAPAALTALLDGLVRVHHERLLEQDHLLEELVEPTLDHLLDDLLGLALVLSACALEHRALLLDLVGRDVVARDAEGVAAATCMQTLCASCADHLASLGVVRLELHERRRSCRPAWM